MFWFSEVAGMKLLSHFIASYLPGSTLFECNSSAAAVPQFVYQHGIFAFWCLAKQPRCHLR
jgi:hypothetical protein